MAPEVLCPACGHSLAFHPYDDSDDGCQAPLGGLTSHNKCGCPVTLHIFIQDLIKKDTKDEVEKLCKEKKVLKESAEFLFEKNKELLSVTEKLEAKIKTISEILNEAKLVDSGPFYGHFKINYKKQMQEILDRALLETEKNDG